MWVHISYNLFQRFDLDNHRSSSVMSVQVGEWRNITTSQVTNSFIFLKEFQRKNALKMNCDSVSKFEKHLGWIRDFILSV